MPGADEVVTGGFTGTVWTIGFVLVGFRERRIFFGERSVNFIGRNVQEAESVLLGFRQLAPVIPYTFEQVEGADDVGLDEVARPVDGAIDMALGGEVDDGTGLSICQQFADELTVSDVAKHELVTRIPFEAFEILDVAGVGEQI